MELMQYSPRHQSSACCLEWPKAPELIIGEAGEGIEEFTGRGISITTPDDVDRPKCEVQLRSSSSAKREASVVHAPASTPILDATVVETTSNPGTQKLHTTQDHGVDEKGERESLEKTRISATNAEVPINLAATEQPPQDLPAPFSGGRQLMTRWKRKSTLWPNPELSLGTKCGPLGGNECWEAIGPAQQLFRKVDNKIVELLDARVDDLEKDEPVSGNILTFRMYMIGSRPSTARPTLLFTCQGRKPRKRAIKYVKESGILKGHPEVRLAESSMLPEITGTGHLRLLSLEVGAIIGLSVGVTVAVVVGWLFVWKIARRRTVIEILRQSKTPVPLSPNTQLKHNLPPYEDKEMSRWNATEMDGPLVNGKFEGSTMGGCICYAENYFGLTVGHVIYQHSSKSLDSQAPTSSGSRGYDDEFAFDSDDEAGEVDESDIGVTSGASVSSVSLVLQDTTTNSSRLSTKIIQSPHKSESRVLPGTLQDPGDEIHHTVASSSQVTALSVVGINPHRDWSLIRLTPSVYDEFVRHKMQVFSKSTLAPRKIKKTVTEENSVVVMRGISGLAKGRISMMTAMMKLSPLSKFEEVWSVELDSPSVEGDSGSWVVDADNDALYGHIVAGVSGTNTVYIMPAYKVIADIEQSLGGAVQAI